MIRKLGIRRWLAWRLVQLAHRVADTTVVERIVIVAPDGGPVVEWEIEGDAYGGGVSSQTGLTHFSPGYTALHVVDGQLAGPPNLNLMVAWDRLCAWEKAHR
ncbi:Uncharacterised protein [Mycobacteroides abscessus subsp. massiliense]|uniref:hypothetical protein n=1 Tax=Mycobacteroides abscessus TaxID=36809 RepID=UPI0009A73B72|nr:hypothetical protein [Mycobacteroides abscessus]SKM81542.1 Uncharacterised protein [Mycobacteroides abscessus subsp. massiliense]SKM98172.1 Uncharacterised protein [Mycobacteroides abscessus subsp. massiliense]SKN76868.1 Uncharacterised protein [Mycobacteroides abscessus subsp. massiliense]SKN96233.1 Uncharacterised protein [Mycobacteroides abscessus subsp. massiliense]SKO21686.1 Uncharacterised protein [Mycobacteroides abscessus subsp. massiliense]